MVQILPRPVPGQPEILRRMSVLMIETGQFRGFLPYRQNSESTIHNEKPGEVPL